MPPKENYGFRNPKREPCDSNTNEAKYENMPI